MDGCAFERGLPGDGQCAGGYNILLTQGSGYTSLEATENGLKLSADIVAEAIADGRPYVHIEDFTNLRSVSIEGRRCYISHMRKRERHP